MSVVVFVATEVLPGNAAYAILGRNANPARVRALENVLHLNRGLLDQYWVWISGLFTGNLGHSLVNGTRSGAMSSRGSSTPRSWCS